MIVVPLVMLSMIVGITGLGDIRNLGSIGGRTVLYYMATTGISVLIGIVLVNVVQPGKDISHGEERPELAYTLSGDGDRTVNLTNGTWKRTRYSEKYMLMLSDQQVEGEIESLSEKSATVKSWKNKVEGVFHIATDSGEHLPFRRVNGEVVSAEPELLQNGTGLEVKLPVAQEVRGKEERDMGGTLKEVLLGDKSTGKEGMIPRNVFNAMVRMDILPLIFFSLLIGATLSVLGERGRPAISVISGLNDAVMQLVHWIMVLAPVGIFGLDRRTYRSRRRLQGASCPSCWRSGKYSFTVVLGLGVHGIIILPLILLLIARRNPLNVLKGHEYCATERFFNSILLRHATAHNEGGPKGKWGFQPHGELCPAARRYNQHGRHRPLRSHCGDVHRAGLRNQPRTRRTDRYRPDSDSCGNWRGRNPGSRACHNDHCS